MHFEIKDSVYWVGKVDWELRHFHGEEYSTRRGTTYNAFLVRDEKNILIDTVWQPFSKEFVANLSETFDLTRIDAIVANHGEIDHSGALPELLRHIPETPIYCTANAIKSLKGMYHQDWNFKPVKTGDRLDIGNRELVFIEAPMLHWPDSMFTYLTKSNILFSNDAFGQHYASSSMYNDTVEKSELFEECIKYYANILTPFNTFVKKKVDQIVAMNVPVDMICPSHGILWRDDPMQIVKKYVSWADNYKEDQVTILYDTMWNSTRRISEAIAEGIHDTDTSASIKLFNASRADQNDIITEIFRSKALLAGSATINRTILRALAGILEEIRGLGFKKKKAAAFCSYGWSGEARTIITKSLSDAGFDMLPEGPKVQWNPDHINLSLCQNYGRSIGELIRINNVE